MAENPNPTPNPNPIRFGILGCAAIARKVSRAIALAPNAVITAVGSRSLEKARRFIAANGLPDSVRAYGSYEGVLGDHDVDAVYIPLPTSLHVRWAVAAVEKGKHLLLEKPPALCVADLDRILEACGSNNVRFMDTTMLMHHPRTAAMRELMSDPTRFGQLRTISSIFTFPLSEESLQNDIRVKADLDALGALGDQGWYCIRSILWASDYQLPNKAIALRNPVFNSAGVILACGSSLVWDDGKVATFNCSFMNHLTTEVTFVGTRGTLRLTDFVVPFKESSAGFSLCSDGQLNDMETEWHVMPMDHVVTTELPQEALMVSEFARIVGGVKHENRWPEITRKTQVVLDAVKASIDRGFEPVEIVP